MRGACRPVGGHVGVRTIGVMYDGRYTCTGGYIYIGYRIGPFHSRLLRSTRLHGVGVGCVWCDVPSRARERQKNRIMVGATCKAAAASAAILLLGYTAISILTDRSRLQRELFDARMRWRSRTPPSRSCSSKQQMLQNRVAQLWVATMCCHAASTRNAERDGGRDSSTESLETSARRSKSRSPALKSCQRMPQSSALRR